MRLNGVSCLALATTLTAAPAFAASHMGDGVTCENAFEIVDANADRTISAEEAQEASLGQFEAIDADDSGALTRDEYVACMGAAAAETSTPVERTDAGLDDIDRNDDEVLTQGEFMAAAQEAWQGVTAEDAGEAEAVDASRLIFSPTLVTEQGYADMDAQDFATQAALLFFALDTDRDRQLSREEWREKEARMPDMTTVLNKSFQDMDADQSGEVSQDEFEAWHTATYDRTFERVEDARADAAGVPAIIYRYGLYLMQ